MKRNYIIIFCLFLLSTGVCLGNGATSVFMAEDSIKTTPKKEDLREIAVVKDTEVKDTCQKENDTSIIIVKENNVIYVAAEMMPEFPGGQAELMKYLSSNIRYPSIAMEENIQGRVIASFVVEIDGKISNIEIVRGLGGGCDEEVIRIIKNMPKWKPGKNRGETVRVKFALPVKFSLQE